MKLIEIVIPSKREYKRFLLENNTNELTSHGDENV